MATVGGFNVEVFGRIAIDDLLRKGATEVQDNRARLEEVVKKYTDIAETVFQGEGTSIGGGAAWQPLSPYRVQVRSAGGSPIGAGPEHPILQWTGDLKKAATTKGDFSGAEVTRTTTYSTNSVELRLEGNKVEHQYGFQATGKVNGRVPARPFWNWTDAEMDYLMAPFTGWADKWLG